MSLHSDEVYFHIVSRFMALVIQDSRACFLHEVALLVPLHNVQTLVYSVEAVGASRSS